jgi:hypothetical protein
MYLQGQHVAQFEVYHDSSGIRIFLLPTGPEAILLPA